MVYDRKEDETEEQYKDRKEGEAYDKFIAEIAGTPLGEMFDRRITVETGSNLNRFNELLDEWMLFYKDRLVEMTGFTFEELQEEFRKFEPNLIMWCIWKVDQCVRKGWQFEASWNIDRDNPKRNEALKAQLSNWKTWRIVRNDIKY